MVIPHVCTEWFVVNLNNRCLHSTYLIELVLFSQTRCGYSTLSPLWLHILNRVSRKNRLCSDEIQTMPPSAHAPHAAKAGAAGPR